MPDQLTKAGRIRAEICAANKIDAKLRMSMLSLLHQNFEGVNEQDFREDLNAKQGAILLKDGSGGLSGFSTWLFYDARIGDEDLRVAYFGDTIVAKEAWNSQALPGAVIRLLMDEAKRVSPRRLFSLLICSGFRTYRFMPFFCHDFVPRDQQSLGLLELRNRLAQERFGSQFSPSTGIVRLQRGSYHIKKGLSDPDGHAEVDPSVAYFLKANPGWGRGMK